MPYQISVDSEANIGLQPWLQAMSHTTVDIKEHDMPFTGRGGVTSGMIVRVDMPGTPNPEVTLVSVDMHGRPVEGGMLRRIRIEDIEKVAVW